MADSILESFLNNGETYRILFDQLQKETAVHAYLITGEKGTGKRTLLTFMCSSMTPLYCTGMHHPAKGTILPPYLT